MLTEINLIVPLTVCSAMIDSPSAPWIQGLTNTTCYLVRSNFKQNWTESHDYCRTFNSSLASILSPEEFQFLAQYIDETLEETTYM